MASISLEELKKAIAALEESIEFYNSLEDEKVIKIARDACIQRFEFCIELSWKTAKKKMGTSATAPKTIIREMAQNTLISDPQDWFAFLDARNMSSHTYDEKIAKQVLTSAMAFPDYGNKLVVELAKL